MIKHKLFFLVFFLVASSLIFSPVKSLAQQYDACDTANPNYSTECRDESKRDFTKCGEVEYVKYDLWTQGDVIAGQGGVPYPDYDSKNNKIVFSVSIGKTYPHYEIFVRDTTTVKQERITFDSNDYCDNIAPFWFGKEDDKKIGYIQVENKTHKKHFLTIDQEGKNRVDKGSKEELDKLYVGIHQNKECYPITPY
jgi:hypothetical protein